MNEKEPSVMKAPPTYRIPFPSNEEEIVELIEKNKCFNFCTDRSCQPNPGPVGAGYYSNNNRDRQNGSI